MRQTNFKAKPGTAKVGVNADASITAQIMLALLLCRSIEINDCQVDTEGGVVTIGGKSKSLAAKELASIFAGDVGGVIGVLNNVVLTDCDPNGFCESEDPSQT